MRVKRTDAPGCETDGVRVAVVGHVEWVEFARVDAVPRPGDIVHATESWSESGGAGAVAAAELARLDADTAFFTAVGNDELGQRCRAELERLGVRVHAAVRAEPHRRVFTFVDDVGERTITVLGPKLVPRARDMLPWHELADADAAYFVSGDVDALRAARRARVLVATARELETLRRGSVELDALVGSGDDEGERYRPGELDPAPRLVVATAGALGGWTQPGGPFRAVAPPGPVEDTYGCGDSFAAALTLALASGASREDAIAVAADRGAAALVRRGAHGS
jgi:ribokinase